MTLTPAFLNSGCQKLDFDTVLPTSRQVWNLKKIEIWPQVTSGDLEWPLDYFFEKFSSKASFCGIICLLLKKIEIWPSFRDFWPQVTSNDLVTSFSEKMIPRASFLGVICLILTENEICQNLIFTIFSIFFSTGSSKIFLSKISIPARFGPFSTRLKKTIFQKKFPRGCRWFPLTLYFWEKVVRFF